MNIELTLNETRVLGCLMEKSVTTPDQYPLTLNALSNACNQKSSRNPVLSLEPGIVQRTARQLEEKHLLLCEESFKSRIEKYTQRFCNTPFADFQFSAEEFALIAVLLLRGPQTPGELRTRAARLHPFEQNHEVAETLQSLIDHGKGPLVARLPRSSGRQDHEYAHLFSGAIESVEVEEIPQAATRPERGPDRTSELEARVAALERELGELQRVVKQLTDE